MRHQFEYDRTELEVVGGERARLRRGFANRQIRGEVGTDAATLAIEGTGPSPWLGMSGAWIPAGAMPPSAILRAPWSEARHAWMSGVVSGLAVAAFDLVMRL
ncbi:hypothetical protein DK419_00965 [Methylobacterium terrae]|uniref:Uncharacterized protein n=1 Tax=Methylobacterium terrae TaxID=2202827 RepID=A0A2U8WIB3_9HYPH|nr:hypothetical protein [Methylobacterium terrae]AWN45076.1 hypothetical protein DK419_00965 [Methylobacterium terrae]